MKPCPTCGSEMLRNAYGWICLHNMTCGQPIVPGDRDDVIQLERGRLPTRESFRAFREVVQGGQDRGEPEPGAS